MVGEKGFYGAGITELDDMVGVLLKKLEDLGIDDNTIVIFSTDNGAEVMSWPDGGTTPYRGEKNTTWEGGFRVPAMVRWPGVVKPGTVINDIFSHQDWMPTLLAGAGEPNVKEKLLEGHKAAGKTFKDTARLDKAVVPNAYRGYRFDFFISSGSRKAWFEKLDACFKQAGVSVQP